MDTEAHLTLEPAHSSAGGTRNRQQCILLYGEQPLPDLWLPRHHSYIHLLIQILTVTRTQHRQQLEAKFYSTAVLD